MKINRKVIKCGCGCGTILYKNKKTKKYPSFCKGHANKNKKMSEETKQKLSEAAKKRGFFAQYNKTENHRNKVIQSNKNRIVSEETKQKISKTLKGFKHSEETKQKMKKIIRPCAEKHPNWKNGKDPYTSAWYSSISPFIKQRDEKCIFCGIMENLQIHHINYNKKDDNLFNLVTLCKRHHTNLHPRPNFLTKNSLLKNKEKQKEINKYIQKYIQDLKRRTRKQKGFGLNENVM